MQRYKGVPNLSAKSGTQYPYKNTTVRGLHTASSFTKLI